MMMQRHITTNAPGWYTRRETINGKEYIIAPMVMLTEGVHNGSGGPLYYGAAELEHTAAAWNDKPIVVYHPTRNGIGVSADDPDILAKQSVGVVKYAWWNGRKLQADAWIDMDRLTELAPEVLAVMNDGGMVEVSTGLYTDNEYAPGWYGGKNFDYVARNHRPDHLAILPTGVGACSIQDGCGLLQTNETREEQGPMTTNILPLPVWNFANEDEPTANQSRPCGCGGHVENHGGGDRDDNLLPLPVMNFGPCGCAPVANHEGRLYGNVLPLPSTL